MALKMSWDNPIRLGNDKIRLGNAITWDGMSEKENKKKDTKKDKNKNAVQPWSAAEAAGRTAWPVEDWYEHGTAQTQTAQKAPKIKKQSIINPSTKYPWLTLEEEQELDSDNTLSNIMKERKYAEMLWYKKQQEWLDTRADVRRQYISKEATTWDPKRDYAIISSSQALDIVREYLISQWWRWLDVSDTELLNDINQTNKYGDQIINSVMWWWLTPELWAYFLLHWDEYWEAMEEVAYNNAVTTKRDDPLEDALTNKRAKIAYRMLWKNFWAAVNDSLVNMTQSLWDAATYVTKQAMNVFWWLWYSIYNTIMDSKLEQTWVEETLDKINEVFKSIPETMRSDADTSSLWYKAWMTTAELIALISGSTALRSAAASWGLWPYAKKLVERIWSKWSFVSWLAKWAVEWWIQWLEMQAVSDAANNDLSSPKEYAETAWKGMALWTLFRWISWAAERIFLDTESATMRRVINSTKGKWWLTKEQVNKIEKTVETFSKDPSVNNPLKQLWDEMKTEAEKKIWWKIKELAENTKSYYETIQKNTKTKITSSDVGTVNKKTGEYTKDSLNRQLKDKWVWNVTISYKDGKFSVSWTSKAWANADKVLKEFVDALNWSENLWNAAGLLDAIKTAKKVTNWEWWPASKAITEWSKSLQRKVESSFPKSKTEYFNVNDELSTLYDYQNKINWYTENFAKTSNDMRNNTTDFFKTADDLYSKNILSRHYGNEAIWTYYTMKLRAPKQLNEILRNADKTPYPSWPGIKEEVIKTSVNDIQRTKGGLNDLAWNTNTPSKIWTSAEVTKNAGILSTTNDRKE